MSGITPSRSHLVVGLSMLPLILVACGSTDDTASPSTDTSPNEGEETTSPDEDEETSPAPADHENAAACGQETRAITHDLGETTVEGEPEQVVVLEFSYVDALASIGMSPVGIADDDDKDRVIPQIRQEIDDWTSVGLRQSPSLQGIAALDPDLIIADTRRHETIYDQLTDIAPTISFASLQAGYNENLESVRAVGAALNQCDTVDQRLEDHEQTMATLADQVPSVEGTVMFGVSSDVQFTAHDESNYTPEVLQAIGLEYAVPHEGEDAQAEMNLETLVSFNPDVLFVAAQEEGSLVGEWLENPLGQSISAVENDMVFFVERNLWSRFRGITASEHIAEQAAEFLGGGN